MWAPSKLPHPRIEGGGPVSLVSVICRCSWKIGGHKKTREIGLSRLELFVVGLPFVFFLPSFGRPLPRFSPYPTIASSSIGDRRRLRRGPPPARSSMAFLLLPLEGDRGGWVAELLAWIGCAPTPQLLKVWSIWLVGWLLFDGSRRVVPHGQGSVGWMVMIVVWDLRGMSVEFWVLRALELVGYGGNSSRPGTWPPRPRSSRSVLRRGGEAEDRDWFQRRVRRPAEAVLALRNAQQPWRVGGGFWVWGTTGGRRCWREQPAMVSVLGREACFRRVQQSRPPEAFGRRLLQRHFQRQRVSVFHPKETGSRALRCHPELELSQPQPSSSSHGGRIRRRPVYSESQVHNILPSPEYPFLELPQGTGGGPSITGAADVEDHAATLLLWILQLFCFPCGLSSDLTFTRWICVLLVSVLRSYLYLLHHFFLFLDLKSTRKNLKPSSYSSRLAKNFDYSPFSSPTSRAAQKTEESTPRAFDVPSPNSPSRFTHATDGLATNSRRAPPSHRPAEAAAVPPGDGTRGAENLPMKEDSNSKDNSGSDHLHFSMYKWASKGVTLVMPPNLKERIKGRSRLGGVYAQVSQQPDLPSDKENMPQGIPIFQNQGEPEEKTLFGNPPPAENNKAASPKEAAKVLRDITDQSGTVPVTDFSCRLFSAQIGRRTWGFA